MTLFLRKSVNNLLRVELVYNNAIPAGAIGVNVTAPTIAGYTFLCWFEAYTDGWFGHVWASWAIGSTCDFFTSSGTSSKARKIVAAALYIKNIS